MLSDPTNSTNKEKINKEDTVKKEFTLHHLESMIKQVPKEFAGATTNMSELLATMNTIVKDSPFKQLLQKIEPSIKKSKEETDFSSWKLIELEEEYIIYVEIRNILKEDISIEVMDHIVTIKLKYLLEDQTKKVTTHSVTLPFKIDVVDVVAYFSPKLIDIHIPKKKTNIIPLITRTSTIDD